MMETWQYLAVCARREPRPKALAVVGEVMTTPLVIMQACQRIPQESHRLSMTAAWQQLMWTWTSFFLVMLEVCQMRHCMCIQGSCPWLAYIGWAQAAASIDWRAGLSRPSQSEPVMLYAVLETWTREAPRRQLALKACLDICKHLGPWAPLLQPAVREHTCPGVLYQAFGGRQSHAFPPGCIPCSRFTMWAQKHDVSIQESINFAHNQDSAVQLTGQGLLRQLLGSSGLLQEGCQLGGAS